MSPALGVKYGSMGFPAPETRCFMKISQAEAFAPQFWQREALSSARVGGSRSRGTEASSVKIARARKRRLQELAQENFKDVKLEIPPAFVKGGFRPGKTVNSRRVLGSKKTIANVFDDDPTGADNYMALAASPSKYPSRRLCGVCGYIAKVTCMRCGANHCSLRCDVSHRERCQ